MANKLEARRAETTAYRIRDSKGTDWRRFKRFFRANLTDTVEDAHTWGYYNATHRKPIANPYPPGRRHDAFDLGMAQGYASLHGNYR